MSSANNHEQAVMALLKENSDTAALKGLWSERVIDSVKIRDGNVSLAVALPFPADHFGDELKPLLVHQLSALDWVRNVDVSVRWNVGAPSNARNLPGVPGVKNIIAVASGKGGVGKSTTAANLALALAYEGAQVGMLDADIYGPSQPRLFGLDKAQPTSPDGKTLVPPVAYGIKVMSIGLLVDEEQPMVWRGPMVTQALNQFLMDTRWGELDYLIVDMPPGTGDIALTLSQRVPVSGAVIVTTPQDIALLDARKGLKMFQKVSVPVLGIVENMSTHVCSRCGHEEPIFGSGGGRRMAEQYGVELLGELPLDIRIREQSDAGAPTMLREPQSAVGSAYLSIARRAAAHLAELTVAAAPTITIEAS